MIRYTSLGKDRHGADIVAFFKAGKMKISVGHGLLENLRNNPQFIESINLPGERPREVAA